MTVYEQTHLQAHSVQHVQQPANALVMAGHLVENKSRKMHSAQDT